MSKKEILNLKEIEAKLKDRKLQVVSQYTKLSFPTLKKLADGKEGNFTYNTIKSVSDYLQK